MLVAFFGGVLEPCTAATTFEKESETNIPFLGKEEEEEKYEIKKKKKESLIYRFGLTAKFEVLSFFVVLCYVP